MFWSFRETHSCSHSWCSSSNIQTRFQIVLLCCNSWITIRFVCQPSLDINMKSLAKTAWCRATVYKIRSRDLQGLMRESHKHTNPRMCTGFSTFLSRDLWNCSEGELWNIFYKYEHMTPNEHYEFSASCGKLVYRSKPEVFTDTHCSNSYEISIENIILLLNKIQHRGIPVSV